MATVWSNFNNGDTGLVVRNALNVFNTGISSDMVSAESRLTANEGRLTATESATSTNTNDVTALDARVVINEDYISNPKPSVAFELVTPPVTHIEGQVYYDNTYGSLKVQGPTPGVEVAVGHDLHLHVINNTGVTLLKGTPVRHNGVAGGVVQVVPAQADSFTNARVLGVIQEDILNLETGAVISEGSVRAFDTAAIPSGVPIYLSDTIPGGLTEIPPDIITQVGGVLTSDALTGELYVKIVNNTNLPTVFSGLKGLVTPTVLVGLIAEDVINYVQKEEIVMLADLTTGVITVSNNGVFRASITADVTFPSATSTRTLFVELYDNTNNDIIFTYAKNIPRDAVEDSFSFNYPFSSVIDTEYKLRVRSSVAITVVANDVTFDIQSISIV